MKVSNNNQVKSGQELERLARPNKLTRYAFYAVVVAFPWESLDIGLGGNFSLAKLAGLFFFGVALLQPRICFRFPPKAFWLFLLYFCMYVLIAIVGDATYDRAIFMRGVSIAQMVVLFWLSYNLMHDERVVKGFLLAFIGACLSLAIGGVFMEEVSGGVRSGDIDGDRLTFLGDGPNTTGAIFALGSIAVLGLAYGRKERENITRFLAWVPFLLMCGLLVNTGSRGGILALAIGMAFFFVKGGNIRTKIGLGFLVLIGVVAIVGLSLHSGTSKRFEDTLNEGYISGRDVIYMEAAGMVNEKPLMGWGPIRNRFELGTRVGQYGRERDAHNLWLKLLLEVGILGTLPFLLGIGMCFLAGWEGRNGSQGALPVSMLVALLMVNMSMTWDNRKIFWIILAYGLISANYSFSRGSIKEDLCSGQRYGNGFRKSSKKSDSPIMVGQSN